jgi:hypothetical protein
MGEVYEIRAGFRAVVPAHERDADKALCTRRLIYGNISMPPPTSNGESNMAYGIVHFFPGGTKEQYEASIGAAHPSRNTLPKGQIFHAAGPSAGGWTIVAVHDTRQSWETFRDQILVPKMRAGIPGGFAAPPQEQAFDVHFQKASSGSKSPARRPASARRGKKAAAKGKKRAARKTGRRR